MLVISLACILCGHKGDAKISTESCNSVDGRICIMTARYHDLKYCAYEGSEPSSFLETRACKKERTSVNATIKSSAAAASIYIHVAAPAVAVVRLGMWRSHLH